MFGLQRGEVDEAAEPRAALDQRYPMAAARRGLGRLHAGRPAADHDDMLFSLRLDDEALAHRRFAPGAWIVDASHPLLLHHLVDAAVVAGDTVAHEMATPGAEFVGSLRIGDQLSRHADEVGIARRDEAFAALRGETAEGDDRQASGALQADID